MNTLYLCGASNPEGVRLAQAVNRVAGRWERVVLLDDDIAKHGQRILGVDVAGPFAVLAGAHALTSEVANLVARTTKNRSAARGRIEAHGLPFASLIDPDVDTSGVDLGPETTVYEHATICPGSAVGAASVVFMNAVVGHGSRVGSCCVIGPGAVLNARVELAEGVYVGSNATVLPDVRVGAWATIGAGSVVLQDVPQGATVFGVPAQVMAKGDAGSDYTVSGQASAAGHEALRFAAELELTIAGVWRDVLGLAAVDVQVSFFDLGGNSLRALQVYTRLQETMRRDLVLTDLFRFPTVRSLAQHLSVSTGAPEERGVLRRRMPIARRRIDTPAETLGPLLGHS